MSMKYLATLAILVASPAAMAQPAGRTTVRIGQIDTAQECNVYEGIRASSETSVSGSAGGYANRYGAGGYAEFAASNVSTFETFFVKDCYSHFEGIRAALEAALASSGSLTVGSGSYVISGRVEDVVPVESGYSDRSATGGGDYGSAVSGLRVTVNISVKDKAGRTVFGAPIVTEIETGSDDYARGSATTSQLSGEGLYGLLQRQIALATARKLAFHFTPLAVVQGGGRKIQLNYGGPLLEVGTILSVTSPDGGSAARYRVTSTGSGTALAQQVGDANSMGIVAGSRAEVIEKGDPAANQSTLERVELP